MTPASGVLDGIAFRGWPAYDEAMIRPMFESILLSEILMGLSVVSLGVFLGWMLRKMAQEKHPWLLLGLILLGGLTLRWSWIQMTQPVPESDFSVYWETAKQIYHGDLSYDIIERHPGIILLYTFAFYLLGPHLWAGWMLNLLFSLFFLLVLYKLTQELFGKKAGLLAVGLGALLPQLVTYTALMASEIPAVTFFLMIIWAFLQTRSPQRYPMLVWVGIGMMLYGSVLIRSTSLILLGMMVLVVLMTRRENLQTALRGCLIMGVTAGILLSTWVTHQYLITGVPKLFFGEGLWLAFATQYDREGGVFAMSELPYYAKFHAAQDGTMAGKLRSFKVLEEESWKIIKADPARYFWFGFTRMKNIVWGARTGILWSTKASERFPKDARLIRRLTEISTQIWRVLLLASLLGLMAFKRSSKDKETREGHLLIWLFVSFWLGFHFLMAVASERYSFQILPFVLIMAAGGCIQLLNTIFPKKTVLQPENPQPSL